MCKLDWLLLLEYIKVFLSWPPVALAIVALIAFRFRHAIDGFIARMVRGSFLGQSVEAVPPHEQNLGLKASSEDLLNKAAASEKTTSSLSSAEELVLPPELEGDPRSRDALNYIIKNPIETLLEYKRIHFSYQAERLFARIYGTQVALLLQLSGRPNEKLTLANLAKFHDEHQRLAKRTDYQLRQYVEFLVNFGVIVATGPSEAQSFNITQQGVEFISYIKANYPEDWDKRHF